MLILSILKKYWQEVTIVILLIIVAFMANTCQNNKSDIDVLREARRIDSLKVVEYKDKNNRLTFQVQSHEVTINQVKAYASELGLKKGELEQQVGKLSNLVAYWKGKAVIKDTFTVTAHDTTVVYKNKQEEAKVFHYDNSFLQLDQLYHPSDFTLSTSYSYNLDYSLTVYRKGHTFFRQGTLVGDLRFKDQNIKVTQLSGITIKDEPKRWYETGLFKFGVGFVAGAYLMRK